MLESSGMLTGFMCGCPGSDCVACPKKIVDKNRANPTATRLITTPDTMWSTRKVTVARAWIVANVAPASIPISSPMIGPHGRPQPRPSGGGSVKWCAPHDPVTVPTIIMPSRPIFTMPERSLNRPPSPVR